MFNMCVFKLNAAMEVDGTLPPLEPPGTALRNNVRSSCPQTSSPASKDAKMCALAFFAAKCHPHWEWLGLTARCVKPELRLITRSGGAKTTVHEDDEDVRGPDDRSDCSTSNSSTFSD